MNADNNCTRPRSLRQIAIGTGAMIGLSAAMLMPNQALAQDTPAVEPEALATVQVEDTAIDPNPNAQLGVPTRREPRATSAGPSRSPRRRRPSPS